VDASKSFQSTGHPFYAARVISRIVGGWSCVSPIFLPIVIDSHLNGRMVATQGSRPAAVTSLGVPSPPPGGHMNAANRRGFLKFAGAGRGRSRRHRHTSAAPGKISTADQPRELRASGRGGRVVGRLTRSSHVPCPTGGPCIPWCSAGYTEAPTTSTSAPTDPSGSPSPTPAGRSHRQSGHRTVSVS